MPDPDDLDPDVGVDAKHAGHRVVLERPDLDDRAGHGFPLNIHDLAQEVEDLAVDEVLRGVGEDEPAARCRRDHSCQ